LNHDHVLALVSKRLFTDKILFFMSSFSSSFILYALISQESFSLLEFICLPASYNPALALVSKLETVY